MSRLGLRVWGCSDRTSRADRDRGSSVIEFVMISTLLVFLLFAVLQVAMYAYARNVVAASAADGARYGANAGVPAAAGGARATGLVRDGLSASAAERIPCTGGAAVDAASGLAVATVRCRGQLKMVFLPLRVPLWVDVTSSALKEGQP